MSAIHDLRRLHRPGNDDNADVPLWNDPAQESVGTSGADTYDRAAAIHRFTRWDHPTAVTVPPGAAAPAVTRPHPSSKAIVRGKASET